MKNAIDPRLQDLLLTAYWMPKLCPKCAGDVMVYKTPPRKNQPGIDRIRECLECGFRFESIEILKAPLE